MSTKHFLIAAIVLGVTAGIVDRIWISSGWADAPPGDVANPSQTTRTPERTGQLPATVDAVGEGDNSGTEESRSSRAVTAPQTNAASPVSASVTLPRQPSKRVGRTIEDFSLRDSYGKEHHFRDYHSADVVVVAFLGIECPLAKLYAPRLVALAQEYSAPGVAFLGIASNTQDAVTEINRFVQETELPFPVLKDPAQRVADAFGATRTPEVFVLDRQRKVRYAGRVDDQYGIGYQRSQPQEHYLRDAIASVLAGDSPGRAETEAVGCILGRARELASDGPITYASHIADILNRRCVECHRDDQIAPFPLASYDDLIGWGDMILEVVDQRRMPPWHANPEYGHFRNDARLSQHELDQLRTWVESGMPQGDPADIPPPREFAQGWRIPEPDQVIRMSDKPFAVPAEGVVDYQYFEVDPGFTEDKYICAAEAHPGNLSVVHHIIVYVKAPGQQEGRMGGMIAGYAPGSPPRILNDGMAIRVPAGSKLLFEMHYTPNGSSAEDLSYLGLKFLAADQVRKLIFGNLAINQDFRIPPHADDHVVTAEREIRQDLLLLSLTPHMHLRGKAFRYDAHYPDGSSETLLDVPAYDFNWQLTYELAEPKLLPKGTRIHCTAIFDNSKQNPANPDPSAEVGWGEQSWHEMMIGFFDVTTPD